MQHAHKAYFCKHIVLFTNNHKAIKNVVNTSWHSMQGLSVEITSQLRVWFANSADHHIALIHAPPEAEWRFQVEAAVLADTLTVPHGAGGLRTSWAMLREDADRTACIEHSKYLRHSNGVKKKGLRWLPLRRTGGSPLVPNLCKSKDFLKMAPDNISLMSKITRCITAHAPIG